LRHVAATDTSAWHLLLEDLTDSHFRAPSGRCRRRLRNARVLCKRWRAGPRRGWDNPRLGVRRQLARHGCIGPDFAKSGDQFARFTDRYGEMTAAERESVQTIVRSAPRLHRALSIAPHLTIHSRRCAQMEFLSGPADGGEGRSADRLGKAGSIDTATDDLPNDRDALVFPIAVRRIERTLLDALRGDYWSTVCADTNARSGR